MRILRVAVALSALMLHACAPLGVRMDADQNQAPRDYSADLARCEDQASRVEPINNVIANTVVGAIFGALLGRAVGLNGHDTTQVAAVGAINGAANGLVWGSDAWQAAVDRCMARRGYDASP